jgi:hypothetical protein
MEGEILFIVHRIRIPHASHSISYCYNDCTIIGTFTNWDFFSNWDWSEPVHRFWREVKNLLVVCVLR